MALTDHRSALREGLDPDPHPEPDAGERLAAVLAVLIEEPVPSLLFTERAAQPERRSVRLTGFTDAPPRVDGLSTRPR